MPEAISAYEPFDIRAWIDYNRSGRAACPACVQAGKIKQQNLSIDLTTGAYHCWRGCATEQIRAALGAPKGISSAPVQTRSQPSDPVPPPRTITQEQVQRSQYRLLNASGQPPATALAWLEGRGFTREMVAHYHLGLEPYWFAPDASQPEAKDCAWAIAVHIPATQPDQFYRKLRIAPWRVGENRPDCLPKWTQYRVPTTIFYTYLPELATETWFCEGEWDAMRLGWLARQVQSRIAICCSTAGCGTVPNQTDLEQLPGTGTIFFDRNDAPTQNGTIPGEAGAQKLALALGDRGRIASVPMLEDCAVQGWDVSNALDAGFTWADFASAAQAAVQPARQWVEQSVPLSLRDQILNIFAGRDTPFERELALMELSREAGYSYRDIDRLATSLATEVDLQFDQAEADRKLKRLMQTRPTQLDLTRYLEPWFARTLIETAKAMPTAPEFLFTTLLPAAASRMGTGAQVVVKPSAKYTQPMVFWSAIVANSGSMKTPAQRVILDPLIALEREAYETYQTELADYRTAIEHQKGKKREEADNPPPPPIRKRYLTKDSTLETLQRLHAENPRGLLYYRDELAGVIKVRNQYRGGHGADEEAELDQWVGSAVIVDRAEKSLCLPRSAISRTGAIQWEILAELMGDHRDVNGAWSRWLFCAAESPPRYLQLLTEEPDTGISEALTDLYRQLETIPQRDYLLRFEAKQLFETWQHQLVDAQRSEEALGLQRVYPKIESYTARLALWLHLVNAVLRGEHPSPMIAGNTMERAIELAAYYLWQHRLIHTHNSPDSGLAAIGLKIQKFAERVGVVTASRLKSGIRALRKLATHQIRQLMQTLASAGYGCVQGEGTEMTYVPASDDRQLQLDLSPAALEAIDPVAPQLMNLSIDELEAEQAASACIDPVDTPPVSLSPTECPDPVSIDALDQLENQPKDAAVMSEQQAKFLPQRNLEEHQTITSDSDVNQPRSFQPGQQVEIWREGQWILATYLKPISHSILSHRTHQLDDGHQVELRGSIRMSGLLRVAISDIRLLLGLQTTNSEINSASTD